MTEVGNGVWTASVTCGHEEFPLSYRYVVNTKGQAGAERMVSEPLDRRLPLEALVRARVASLAQMRVGIPFSSPSFDHFSSPAPHQTPPHARASGCPGAACSSPLRLAPATPFCPSRNIMIRAALLQTQAGKNPEVVVANGGHVRSPSGGWRGAGVAVPTFSLRSRASVGCGEFLDLVPLVDVAASTGLRVVQILPVNDTRVHGMWWDSYPYSSVSVFALHPMYLRLQALDTDLPEEILADIERARSKLDLKDVDYDATVATKVAVARRVFDLRKRAVVADDSFQAFVDSNAGWLKPYAAFMILKDLFGSADHTQWGLLSQPSAEVIDKLTRPESDCADAAHFVFYLQWHLHRQLHEASLHAKARRVVLKGDLPIGVDKRSVDTWLNPRLFRMNTSTGAPPDSFDPNGQNWGFPTYNWEEMQRDEHSWWCAAGTAGTANIAAFASPPGQLGLRSFSDALADHTPDTRCLRSLSLSLCRCSRLRQMSQYFSAYRIDHVLGMFRIWELPAHAVGGIMGRFRPALPLTKHELESRGLWDTMRLEEPHVRNPLLHEQFGQRAMDVACRFLVETSPGSGRWRFREEFATERGIVEAECLAPRAGSPQWLLEELAATKASLLSLVRNVVLLRDPEHAGGFHPRFHLEQTSAFRELESWQQDAVRDLHADYYARQDSLWRRHALRTLPVLQHATGMLVCGEDLGSVPPCVHEVMLELGVVGLRIQRMPPNDGEFDRPAEYPYLTVCSPSCHDTTTTRAWCVCCIPTHFTRASSPGLSREPRTARRCACGVCESLPFL